MDAHAIAQCRLVNQQIALTRCRKAVEVVSVLGAMQAQDYLGALWAIGLRLPAATETEVAQAIAERKIVRTWPMRGTLHFVAAADVRWMLKLLTPRIIAGSTSRSQRLELDATVYARCRKVFVRALQGDRQHTREAMMELLELEGISTAGQRGYHILWRLAQEGLLCFAARSGKEATFALLDEWVPKARSLDRDASLAELAHRYFIGHGPATLRDFVWWSGLKMSDARVAVENAGSRLARQTIDGTVYWMPEGLAEMSNTRRAAYLLPGFDEYLLGYKDRSAVLEPRHAPKVVPGSNGVFQPTIVIDGRVVGTWKRVLKKEAVVVTASPFAPLKRAEKILLADAAERYGRFLGMPAEMTVGYE